MSELRSWFLRNVFEAAERQLGSTAVSALLTKLPPRLARHASLETLRASAAFDTVLLSEGEELLLSMDALIGDGSGKLLEGIGVDLASRMLSQEGSLVRAGDLAGTVARLHAFLEHPFVGVPLSFDLRRNDPGFCLTIGVIGHSRATRVVRHLTVGAIVAAERFSRQAGAECLKVSSESLGDRSSIRASYLARELNVVEEEPPRSRRPTPSRAPSASLSEQVERILRSSTAPQAPSEATPLAAPHHVTKRPRSSVTPPRPVQRAGIEADESQPPQSMTVRISSTRPARGPALK